ncbi:TMEM165/GDT1 family protein [Phenylobacterium sp. J367]|uniref:TMEM165/GDT1 family protein n=1 Tax=Phenylobacterium sp. J367 TaxID=2898435 RepID=UPI0021517186|nr:TMEM165/GDT1 family protein [Phenylobacterium sp. J367]MCR5880508.1 TMEM165/GDT1 family protein [Phenylobacterium sp. J367]
MEPFLISTGVVAIAEIGDKTQLLAMVLAARFRKPVPIILGILCATILNHAAAAGLGVLIAQWLEGRWLQALVGAAFVAMAAWALIPDKEDEDAAAKSHGGVFLTTLVAFFLVEIGDKTQIATSLLAARFENLVLVTAATTLGMMLSNVPAVFLGEAATKVVPLKVVRIVAAVIFGLIGLWVLAAAFLPGGFRV